MNVKIGFYLGDGSLRNQIDNQQCLAGTFYITAYRLQTRINFVCTESAARITDYTDQQLRVVARACLNATVRVANALACNQTHEK